MFPMRYKRQAGTAANVSCSKVILGQQDKRSGSFDHFALSFLFCRWVKSSALYGDTPENPTILVVFTNMYR